MLARTAGAAPSKVEARCRIRDDRARGSPESRDNRVARAIGKVHEEPVAADLRRKRQPEQPALSTRQDVGRQIEEVGRQHGAVLNDANVAVLLDNELDAAVGGILDERDRTRESRGVRARAKLRLDVGRQQADEASGQPPAAHARIVTHAAGQPSMIRSRENRVLPCSRPGRQLGRRVRLHPHLMKWFQCCFLAIVTVACGADTPEPPVVTPGPPETVAGTERLGWTQRATDAAELSTFRYAAYVDGARAELTGVSCQPLSPQTSSDFDCTAPLPPMSTGPHTLELATFIVDGDLLESGRSAPLQVNRTSAPTAVAPAPPATWASGTTVGTADGLRLRIDRIAEGLVRPTDLAFLPDGRVLVAEEAGQVRVLMPDGRLLAEPALPLRRGRIRRDAARCARHGRGLRTDTLRVCDLHDGIWRRQAALL